MRGDFRLGAPADCRRPVAWRPPAPVFHQPSFRPTFPGRHPQFVNPLNRSFPHHAVGPRFPFKRQSTGLPSRERFHRPPPHQPRIPRPARLTVKQHVVSSRAAAALAILSRRHYSAPPPLVRVDADSVNTSKPDQRASRDHSRSGQQYSNFNRSSRAGVSPNGRSLGPIHTRPSFAFPPSNHGVLTGANSIPLGLLVDPPARQPLDPRPERPISSVRSYKDALIGKPPIPPSEIYDCNPKRVPTQRSAPVSNGLNGYEPASSRCGDGRPLERRNRWSNLYSVYIGNIYPAQHFSSLWREISRFGQVINFYFPNRRSAGKPAFAFFRFKSRREAARVIWRMDGRWWFGRKLSASFAKPSVRLSTFDKGKAPAPSPMNDDGEGPS